MKGEVSCCTQCWITFSTTDMKEMESLDATGVREVQGGICGRTSPYTAASFCIELSVLNDLFLSFRVPLTFT